MAVWFGVGVLGALGFVFAVMVWRDLRRRDKPEPRVDIEPLIDRQSTPEMSAAMAAEVEKALVGPMFSRNGAQQRPARRANRARKARRGWR